MLYSCFFMAVAVVKKNKSDVSCQHCNQNGMTTELSLHDVKFTMNLNHWKNL